MSIIFQRGNDSKKRVVVEEHEKSRIRILDGSPGWRRITSASLPTAPVTPTERTGGGETPVPANPAAGTNPPAFKVEGLPPTAQRALEAANMWSRDAIVDATDEELLELDGFGETSLEIIRREVK